MILMTLMSSLQIAGKMSPQNINNSQFKFRDFHKNVYYVYFELIYKKIYEVRQLRLEYEHAL